MKILEILEKYEKINETPEIIKYPSSLGMSNRSENLSHGRRTKEDGEIVKINGKELRLSDNHAVYETYNRLTLLDETTNEVLYFCQYNVRNIPSINR